MSAARLLALGLAALAFGCVPSGAQQEAKQVAECLMTERVRSCLAGIGCSGPTEFCKTERLAHELSCLELCTKKPGEVSVIWDCIVDAPFDDPRRCADAGDVP